MTRPKPINTDRQAAALKPGPAKYAARVKDCAGCYLRVTPSGTKTYAAVARDPRGKQVWATIGGMELSVDQARDALRALLRAATAENFAALVTSTEARVGADS